MGLSTWLKENRLQRVHAKLRRLRSEQKHLRDEAETIDKQKKRGAADPALEARELKLHEEREKLTQEISALVAEEDQLKDELKAAGIVPAR